MSMTILVTGGAGLLGHAVLEEFANLYHCIARDITDVLRDRPDLRAAARAAFTSR